MSSIDQRRADRPKPRVANGTSRPRSKQAPQNASSDLVIDDLDRALVERLRVDGRESNRSLASTLDVNEATVASRLRRLEAASIMRVVALTDMTAFGFEHLCFGKLLVRGRPVAEVGEELSEITETISVTLSAGRFDLIVCMLARDGRHLSDLVSHRIPAISGVDEAHFELALDVLRFESMWALLSVPARHLPPPAIDGVVDELDLSIIGLLQKDARSSNRRIAGGLDVSEGTVRSRIRRMEERGLIRIQALSDVLAFGLSLHAYVGIQVEGGQIDAASEGLLRCERIAVLVRSLGDYDLLALVTATDRAALEEIILREISQVPGVRHTETFESWRSLKHSYAWARLI